MPAGTDNVVAYDINTDLIHVLTTTNHNTYTTAYAPSAVGLSGDAYAKPDGMVFDPLSNLFRFSNSASQWFSMTTLGVVADTGNAVNPRWSATAFDQVTTNPVFTPTPSPTPTPKASSTVI